MLQIGNIKQVKIIDENYMGKGVAKIDDFVVFVDNALSGEIVEIKITEKKKNFAIGKNLKIIQKSSKRIEPPCEYFPKCGGCQLMHMDYKEQLIYKKNRVINELKRAGVDIENATIYDTINADNLFEYRNKTAFSVTKKNNEIIIGPYEQGTYNTIDIKSCMLQNKIANEIINLLKIIMIKYKIDPYDKKTRNGIIRNLVIRSNKENEIMLIIVTKTKEFPNKDLIVKELTTNIKQIKTIVQNINEKNNNLVMGQKNITIYGAKTITDTIDNLVFSISPDTFFQINNEQTQKLYDKAMEYADFNKEDILFDLYCGIGTISLMVAPYVKKVYGVEIVEQSILNARQNAKTNNIENTEFLIGESEKVLPKLYNQNIKADVIILDPTRKGCEKEVIETIIKMSPKKVVYISCNPSTLSRDIKLLQDGNYKLKKVQPVDQFIWATHVEVCCCLTRV